MSEPSLESSDELIREFISENKHQMVDPEQNPAVFRFMVKSFLYQKQMSKGKLDEN